MQIHQVVPVIVTALLLAACDDPAPQPTPPYPPTVQARPEYSFKFELKRKEKLVRDGVAWDYWTAAISPDGKFVAAAPPGRPAAVWDVETWEEVPVEGFHGKNHGGSLSFTAFSPSGNWLVFVSKPDIVELIDWTSRRRAALLEDAVPHAHHYGPPMPLEPLFSSNENLLATGWFEAPIEIYKLPELEPAMTLSEGRFSAPIMFSESAGCLLTMGRPLVEESGQWPLRESGVRAYSIKPWRLERVKIDPDFGFYGAVPYGDGMIASVAPSKDPSKATVICWRWSSFEEIGRRTLGHMVGQFASHPPTGQLGVEFGSQQGEETFETLGYAMFDPLGSAWEPVIGKEQLAEFVQQSAVGGAVGLMASVRPFTTDGKRCAMTWGPWLLVYDVSWEERR